MKDYLDQGLFVETKAWSMSNARPKTMFARTNACLDLEAYDFRKAPPADPGDRRTILERIPPRSASGRARPSKSLISWSSSMIRKTWFSDLSPKTKPSRKLYDFKLMMDSGRLAGYRVDDPASSAEPSTPLWRLPTPHRSPKNTV